MPMRALAARVHANPSNVTVIVARLEARLLADHPAVQGLTRADQRRLLHLLRRLTAPS